MTLAWNHRRAARVSSCILKLFITEGAMNALMSVNSTE